MGAGVPVRGSTMLAKGVAEGGLALTPHVHAGPGGVP